MRFDMRIEAWTDGQQSALVWDNGHVAVYQDAELIEWLAVKKPWPWGSPPERVRTKWSRTLGWPEGAVDAAGPYSLWPQEGSRQLTLRGPEPLPQPRLLPFDEVSRRWADDDEPEPPPEGLSRQAHLCPGPEGVTLVDAQQGLVACPQARVAWRLEGVDEEWGLQAVRVPGAIIVHAACQHRSGQLARITDAGQVQVLGYPYGFVCPLHYMKGRVFAVLPQEGLVTDGPMGHGLFSFLPRDKQVGPVIYPLAYGPWASAVAKDRWVVGNGHRAVMLRLQGGRWRESHVLEPPRGEPTRLHGPATLRAQPAGEWSGPAGAFSLQWTLENAGQDLVGLQLEAIPNPAASPKQVSIGEEQRRFVDGVASFDHQALRHGEPLTLTLSGQVSGPTELRLNVVSKLHEPVSPSDPQKRVHVRNLGKLLARLGVRGGLLLRRDEATLALEPAWVTDLGRARLLDDSATEPDLQRWMTRALRRCRVDSLEEAPDQVTAAWLRMSKRERQASTPDGIPAYKLRSGQRWIITDDEARGIAKALGPEHPLGAFCAAGGFEVTEPAHPD